MCIDESLFKWYVLVHIDLDLEDLEEEVKADVVINIRELDDVLMKDVGDKIAQSNK